MSISDEIESVSKELRELLKKLDLLRAAERKENEKINNKKV